MKKILFTIVAALTVIAAQAQRDVHSMVVTYGSGQQKEFRTEEIKDVTFYTTTYCTVTFDSDGGSPVKSIEVPQGGVIGSAKPTTTKDGYIFDGWYYKDQVYDFYNTKVNEDITLTAVWTKLPDSEFKQFAFSVSDKKTVYFSPGNLQYHAKDKKWRFAPHQWETIGEGNNNVADDYDGWIDLFGWGTGDNPTKISTDKSQYSTFNDWGKNVDGGYYTLSIEEWEYLISQRQNAAEKYGVAEVAGMNGLILLPDNFTAPIELQKSFNSGCGDADEMDIYGKHNTYTLSEWSKMESNGAVFLPAAGCRDYETLNFTRYNRHGNYWSSTSLNVLFIGPNQVVLTETRLQNGKSVRLVTDKLDSSLLGD